MRYRGARSAVLAPILLLALVFVSGCGSGYSSQAMVYFANLSHSSVSVRTVEPSGKLERVLPFPPFLAFSGDAFDYAVRPCWQGGMGLPIRGQAITIRSDTASYSFVLHDPDGPGPTNLWGAASIWIVIHPDGTISRTSKANTPPSPYCGA